MVKIIFDWKRTLYDPDNKSLISGAEKLLNYLKRRKISLILIGKGGVDMYEVVNKLEVKKFFSKTVFIDQKKDINLFKKFTSKGNFQSTIVVGDRVRSELEIGNIIGATTIWVRQGKFADEKPLNNNQKPKYTVNSLTELKNLLIKIIK